MLKLEQNVETIFNTKLLMGYAVGLPTSSGQTHPILRQAAEVPPV
jgi:hypothetical protein